MRVLDRNATDEEILAVCREWLELLAEDRLEEALNLMAPASDGSVTWTPDALRTYISNYGSWEPWGNASSWRVTSPSAARLPADAPNRKPYAEVGRLAADARRGWVLLDLPLNGIWSDLTAEFEFSPVEEGTGVTLHDLHVL
jgi:hypothetical protein